MEKNVRTELLKGALLMSLAYACMAFFGLFSRMASDRADLKPEVLFFWQSFIGLICTLPSLPKLLKEGGLKTQVPVLHGIREIATIGGFLLFYYAIAKVPMADCILLNNAAPLYIPILAYFWGGQKIHPALWIGIGIGFIGILCVLNPSEALFQDKRTIAVLVSGLFAALAVVSLRKLGPTEPPTRTLFYLFLVCTVLFAPSAWIHAESYTWDTWGFIALVGFSVYLFQFFISAAMKHGSPSVLGVFAYVSVIVSGILDWLIYGISPTPLKWLGISFVVIGSITTLLLGEMIASKAQKKVKAKKP